MNTINNNLIIPIEKLLESRTRDSRGNKILLKKNDINQPSGLIILDENYIVHQADEYSINLLQVTRKYLIGNKFKWISPGVKQNEYSIKRSGGGVNIISLNSFNSEWKGIKSIFIFLYDVTWRQKSADRLDLAIEATELGLWDYNHLTNTTTVNEYYATMLGYTLDEFDPGMWIKLLHPIDLVSLWKSWTQHMNNEIPIYSAEYRILSKSGEWIWIHARGKVRDRDKDGNTIHYTGTHQEITYRKQANQELQILYFISELSSTMHSFEKKVEGMLWKILEVVGIPKGIIHLFDGDTDTLQLSANCGFHEMKNSNLDRLGNEIISLLKNVDFQKNIIQSTGEDKNNRPILKIANAALYATIPILLKGKKLGYLSVFWEDEQPFTNLDGHLLDVAANQIAIALEKEKFRQLAENAVIIEERQRLARELHDSLSQSLYSLALMADGGRDFSKLGDLDRAEEIFGQIGEDVLRSIKEMRLLVYELRPSMLAKEGLIGALQSRLEVVEKRAGIKAHLEVEVKKTLSSSLEGELYGIAQEALNNVLKHSDAKEVWVFIIEKSDNLYFEIRDDGIGFNILDAGINVGIGLSSIKERVERISGTVKFVSKMGFGTQVIISIPSD
jgi:PAS domain S-box-containing protein